MSSSKPESFVSLLDSPEDAEKKIMRALTGGRATAEEQRRLGGEPEKCAVFEFYNFHLVKDDEEINEIERNCREGRILCGKCKRMAADMIKNFLRDHQEKMQEVEGRLDMYNLIV
jgi:tryptophanyl-tRNA synthetase